MNPGNRIRLNRYTALSEQCDRILKADESYDRVGQLTPEARARIDGLHDQMNKIPGPLVGHFTEADYADGVPSSVPESGEARTLRPDESLESWVEERGLHFAARHGEREDRPLDPEKFWRGAVGAGWDEGAHLERRALQTALDTAGGYAVPSELAARIIDKARARSVVFRAGARTFPMESNTVHLARLDSDPDSEWLGENVAATEQDVTLGQVALQSRKLATFLKMSLELSEDSPNLGAAVENAMAQSVQLGLDRAALRGDQSNGEEPLGLRFTDGVTLTDLSSASPSHDDFRGLWGDLLANDAPVENGGDTIIYAPAIAEIVDGLKDGEGNFDEGPPSFQNARKLVTSQIPTDLGAGSDTEVYRGLFSELIVGLRMGFRLEVSREAGDAFQKFQVFLRGHLRGDIAVAQPSFFSIAHGVGTS